MYISEEKERNKNTIIKHNQSDLHGRADILFTYIREIESFQGIKPKLYKNGERQEEKCYGISESYTQRFTFPILCTKPE